MSTTPQPIYSLLPAIYRSRDDLNGGPLSAFYSVLETQYGIVKDNLLQLYDDQFIETCAPWVIPYIGALIGYDPVYTVASVGPDSRAEVANTIGYRRRKGTLMAMEQVTHDVSGRPTTAIEEFRRLITTLSLRDVRKHHDATANLRRGRDWEDQWGPFTRLNRTVDVRRIAPRIATPACAITTSCTTAAPPDTRPLDIAIHGGGRFNIPDIAVWMWRWQTWGAVTNAPAFSLAASGNSNGYLFSALGGPIPLFQPAISGTLPFSRLTKEPDVPEPIRRRRFCRHTADFYPSDLELEADGVPVPLSDIFCANLEPGPGGTLCTVPTGMIAIDPRLGRIQYAAGMTLPTTLLVTYNYGSPAPFAGGPYDRTASISQASSGFMAIVDSTVVPPGYTAYATLQAAITAWNLLPAGSVGTIVLPNFVSISGIDLTGANAIQILSQSQLLIASAEIPASSTPPLPPPLWNKSCVTLFGNIEVAAPVAPLGPDGLSEPMGSLQISGVWLSGTINLTGAAACVQMTDCTLVPGITLNPDGTAAQPGTPSVTGTAIGASFCLTRSICGPISLPWDSTVRVCNSIVDAGSTTTPAFQGPVGSAPSGSATTPAPSAELHIEDSTIIGKVYAQVIRLASNTIFHSALAESDEWSAAVWANRTQVGCIRFCSLPWSSIVPRRYECLPPNAATEQALAPQFICLRFGDPAYCLLSGYCPMAVWKGADNGSQMGVFLQTQETEAVANIQIRANEYLVANLECGVFLIPSHGCDHIPEWSVGINHPLPSQPVQFGGVSSTQPEPANTEEPQPQAAAPAETEPEVEAQPEPAQAEEVQPLAAATVEAEPKTNVEAEQPKPEEAQHETSAPVAAEPKTEAQPEPEPPKPEEAQHEPVAAAVPEPKTETETMREAEPPKTEIQHEDVASAAARAEADPHPTSPELHETQIPDAHTEGQD